MAIAAYKHVWSGGMTILPHQWFTLHFLSSHLLVLSIDFFLLQSLSVDTCLFLSRVPSWATMTPILPLLLHSDAQPGGPHATYNTWLVFPIPLLTPGGACISLAIMPLSGLELWCAFPSHNTCFSKISSLKYIYHDIWLYCFKFIPFYLFDSTYACNDHHPGTFPPYFSSFPVLEWLPFDLHWQQRSNFSYPIVFGRKIS